MKNREEEVELNSGGGVQWYKLELKPRGRVEAGAIRENCTSPLPDEKGGSWR